MKVSRRAFLRVSAATSGALLARHFLFGELETLRAAQVPAAQPAEE
ncbi:MAG: hypothetical protein N0A24_08965 [Armatimonadetes bacterium]|nr:hypothetical protein [Armatimonadota bacterium]MDW8154320.1 hypothetical protein [Armatimonadota bacterium]